MPAQSAELRQERFCLAGKVRLWLECGSCRFRPQLMSMELLCGHTHVTYFDRRSKLRMLKVIHMLQAPKRMGLIWNAARLISPIKKRLFHKDERLRTWHKARQPAGSWKHCGVSRSLRICEKHCMRKRWLLDLSLGCWLAHCVFQKILVRSHVRVGVYTSYDTAIHESSQMYEHTKIQSEVLYIFKMISNSDLSPASTMSLLL